MILILTASVSLAVIWIGYPCLLFLLARLTHHGSESHLRPSEFTAGIVIAAHNEGERIAERISNIAAMCYPPDKVTIIVASDGSTDNTVDAARTSGTECGVNVVVHDLQPQEGRAAAHNAAVALADCDVLVFTDAETVFDRNCLTELIRPFSDPTIGFASGVLSWDNSMNEAISQHAGLYWRLELAMRRWETSLGVNVFGSGACCAVRRSLYSSIPTTGDIDFTTPLDVVKQGHRCVQVEGALAMDQTPSSARAEFRARVRMTSKNLRGTIGRWGVQGVLHHPILTGVLLLHKIGRWFTPFFGIALVLGSILILPHNTGWILLTVEIGALLLAVAGGMGVPIPLASPAWSFLVANCGFAVGVLKAISGSVQTFYLPLNQRT